MELKPSHGSDRAWIWSTPADFADEEPKAELLALRFANTESECAPAFQSAFCRLSSREGVTLACRGRPDVETKVRWW